MVMRKWVAQSSASGLENMRSVQSLSMAKLLRSLDSNSGAENWNLHAHIQAGCTHQDVDKWFQIFGFCKYFLTTSGQPVFF